MIKKVQLGFENDCVTIPVADILPVRVLSKSIQSSRKYTQITASIREIGLVEPPVVARNGDASGSWLLLDGHVRIEVLKVTVESSVSEIDPQYDIRWVVLRHPVGWAAVRL